MRRLRLLAAVAGIALVTACGSVTTDDDTAVPDDSGAGAGSSEDASADPAPIEETTWQVQVIATADASTEAPADTEAYLRINPDGTVEGNTGCNGFGGSAAVSEGTVTFSQVFSTKIACPDAAGDLDSAMLTFMNGEVTAEVDGDTLTLANPAGQTVTLKAGDEPAAE